MNQKMSNKFTNAVRLNQNMKQGKKTHATRIDEVDDVDHEKSEGQERRRVAARLRANTILDK